MVTSLTDVPPHVVAPPGVELKQSAVSDKETGAWCTEKVTQGSKFGPFVGRTLHKGKAKKVDYRYAWEVINPETNELAHVVDATDPQHGNWMRYVNCARYLEEQNLVSIQDGLYIYYRAIRDIIPGEELLTWYSKDEAETKQRKRKESVETGKDTAAAVTPPKIRKKPGPKPKVKDVVTDADKGQSKPAKVKTAKVRETKPAGKQARKNGEETKRNRKKALSEDYMEDFEDLVVLSKQTIKDGLKEGVIKENSKTVKKSSRGRGGMKTGRGSQSNSGIKGAFSPRGRGRGKSQLQHSPSKKSNTLNFFKNDLKAFSPGSSPKRGAKVHMNPGKGRGRGKKASLDGTVKPGKRAVKQPSSKGGNVEMSENLLWLVSEASMNSTTAAKDGEYSFEILPIHHITGKLGRKMYKCDICAGIYRHAFSLKRHYLRNHIYSYYLSEADISNCKILVAQQEAVIKNKPKNLPPKSETQPASGDNKKAGSSKDKVSLNNDVEKPDGSMQLKRGKNSLQTRPQPVLYPGLYRCYTCNKLFDYIEDLKSHTLDHPVAASEKLFSCTQCSMKFTYKQNLMRHQAVHSGIRPYSCKKCNRNFSTATSLKKHEKTHLGKVPKCKYCKSVFNWRVELKRHMQKVHSEYLHHCPYCQKSFLARCAFQKHLSTHEVDPYQDPELDTSTISTAPTKDTKKKPKESSKRIKQVAKSPSKSPSKSPAKTKCPKKKTLPDKQSKTKKAHFKFACTVCKKRFSSYVNMCRHRRLAHPEVPKFDKPETPKSVPPEIKEVDVVKVEKVVVEQEEWRPCDAKFFASVADNIAYNLNNHIDGGVSSMKEFSNHIRIKGYKSVAEVHDLETVAPTERDQIWTKYNFPSGYEPIISPEEISDGTVIATKTKEPSVVPQASKLSTPLLIKIPEYHRCSVCSCVFSNSESFDWHMKDHQQLEAAKDTTVSNSEVKPEINADCDNTDVAASYLNPGLIHSRSQKRSQTDTDSVGLSPFHRYEEIQFGINRELMFICGVCRKEFANTFELGLHQFKKHPTIDCTYLEVENGSSVERLYYPAPIPTGELAEVKKKPLDSRENHSFTCTRCLSHFSTVTRLYIHIMNCAPKAKLKSLPGKAKRQFANQRSPVVKNRFQDAEKKRESTAKLTSEKIQGTDKKQIVKGIRQRKGISMQDILFQRRQRGGLRYNPRNHVRRREMTDILERHQCNGCGCKFQTISLLERHIKKCDEKEKLKSVKPLKRSSSEKFFSNSKLTCRHCSRQFTYLKFLVNHYRDFCRVRKDKVTKGLLTADDLQDEDRIKAAALSAANHEIERRESSEVAMNAEGSASKRGWPRGVKRKKGRKNHCWTYIKKRKSPDFSSRSLIKSLPLEAGFEGGTPDPSCHLDFNKMSEYSEESSQSSYSQASKESASSGISQVYVEATLSDQAKTKYDQALQVTKPVLKKRKLTLLDFKTIAQKQQETVPFDPSFLPMQQNKSYKQHQSKEHNRTKHSKNSLNLGTKSAEELHSSNSLLGCNLPERLNTLYGLMPKDSSITNKYRAEDGSETKKSVKSERNISVDSGLGSPQRSEVQSIDIFKNSDGLSDSLCSSETNNTENPDDDHPIPESAPASDNGEIMGDKDKENGGISGPEMTAEEGMEYTVRMEPKDFKQSLEEIPEDSQRTESSTTKGQKKVPDVKDSARTAQIGVDGSYEKVKLTPPQKSDRNTARGYSEGGDSSDEDNMVLQRLVDLKSKSKLEPDTAKTSDSTKLPSKVDTSCPKTAKSKKKNMIQPTLLTMFASKKSAQTKSKLKLSSQTDDNNDDTDTDATIVKKSETFSESHKALNSLETSKCSSFRSLSPPQEVPCDNSNSCSLESVTSR